MRGGRAQDASPTSGTIQLDYRPLRKARATDIATLTASAPEKVSV